MKKSSKRKTLTTEDRLQKAHLGIAKVLDESQLSFVEMMGVLELSKIGVTRAMEAREQEIIDNSMEVVKTVFPPQKDTFDRSYLG